MTIETQAQPDDFDAAFTQFAAPDKTDEQAADAIAAAAGGGDNAGSADGGSGGGDAGGSAGAAGSDGGDQGQAAGGEAGAAGTQGAADGGAGEAGADAGAAGDGAAAEQPGADASAPVADAGAAAEAGASPDAILEGLKKLVGSAPAAAQAEAPPQAQEQDQARPIYNQEEVDFLKQYDTDWADVAKGEALKRRAEYKDLLEYVFKQVAEFVKPIHETAEVLAERTFRSELTSTVPDYSDNLREQVVGWVKTQPVYLQVAYNHVITEGTVDEVKHLIDTYRASTGQATSGGAGASPAGQKKQGKGNELSGAAKEAAAALAPVDSKRSGVQAATDPSDFDDAWKQAAAELG